jgi:Ca2+-binding EF-hand superfamily protein
MPRESVDSVVTVIDDFELTEEELQAGNKYGMSRVELVEACRLFRNRIQEDAVDAEEEEDGSPVALRFESVDSLLRQLRIFMSTKVLWALLLEIDENVNGKIEVEEFIGMVAKLRGRSAMSPDFHLRSLPRSLKDSYCKLFDMMVEDDSERTIERDDLVSACKKLNSHVNTNSEAFRRAVEDLNVSDNKYGIAEFLVFQAKLRKQKPEIDVALMSLTDEEEQKYSQLFTEWRSKCTSNSSAQELRTVLTSIGFGVSMEQCRNRLASVELDGSRPIQLREFLYILIHMGVGTSQRRRPILLPGCSYDEAYKHGFTLQEMWELGYDDLYEIKRSGWSVHNVISAGFAEPYQLRQVGYTAGDLRKVGLSAKQMKLAGFSFEELRNAGFSSAVLRECCSDFARHRAQKSSAEGNGLTLRPVLISDRPVTSDYGEQRWWGTPRIQAMLGPDQSNDSIMSIMSF